LGNPSCLLREREAEESDAVFVLFVMRVSLLASNFLILLFWGRPVCLSD